MPLSKEKNRHVCLRGKKKTLFMDVLLFERNGEENRALFQTEMKERRKKKELVCN